MELKIKDIVDLLQVSEKTVYRWIKEKKIPCYRIHHHYHFNRAEVNEWIMSNGIGLSTQLLNLPLTGRPTHLTDLLLHGGVYTGITGNTIRDVLHNAIESIDTPQDMDKEDIISALLNREELMSTAIGNGIAIPHPRKPLITNVKDASVSICFLAEGVNFGALDGHPVHTLFLLLTCSPRRHLEVLSKISYLCQMDDFRSMLERRASAQEISDFVQGKERSWQQKELAER
ncbi:MAG: PTS sugar transporter subunit IIA [Candidatus Latescibacterota bacterium]